MPSPPSPSYHGIAARSTHGPWKPLNGDLPHAPPGEANIAPAIFWSLVILVLLIVGMMAAVRLRRKLKQEDVTAAPVAGFTLSDLRQMHRAGQITDAEFEKAKEKVVLAAQKASARQAPPPGTPVNKDST